MAKDGLIKFLLKVLDENRDQLVWEHFCYVPKDTYLKYLDKFNLERFEMADSVADWAKEDFNIDLAMSTTKDIAIVRQLVLDKYSTVYPHLVRKTFTDHQGWLRVWATTHMEKELMRK